jgi:AcrR family transcriptional regulator
VPGVDAIPSARRRLLDRVVQHLLEHGVGHASLREIAAAIGSSHRMLNFHFGSRAGLLAAVVEDVERRQLEGLRELTTSGPPREVMMTMHRRLGSPELAPVERLFFELYARGLQGDPSAQQLVGPGNETWLQALTQIYRDFGFSKRDAAAEATLALATSRGLLLDLLASGDRARVDAAARRYVQGVVSRLGA